MCKNLKVQDAEKVSWISEGCMDCSLNSWYLSFVINRVVNCRRSNNQVLHCWCSCEVWRHGWCVLGLSLASLEPSPARASSLQPPAGVITSPVTSLLTSPSGNISPLPSHRSGNFSTPSYHLTVLEISNLTAHLTLLETSPLYQLPPHCSGNISTSSERTSHLTSPF